MELENPMITRWRLARLFAAAGMALGLTACSVEFVNLRPAQELAREARPPGSAYLGWRIFQERCASCHGPAALGTDKGPDLLPRMREIGSRRFVGLVLDRYDWNAPLDSAKRQASTRETTIEQLLQRTDAGLEMPAWADEPRVNAHIVDLYAYLTARAEGTIGTGKPSQGNR
jgi:hypothetical protein